MPLNVCHAMTCWCTFTRPPLHSTCRCTLASLLIKHPRSLIAGSLMMHCDSLSWLMPSSTLAFTLGYDCVLMSAGLGNPDAGAHASLFATYLPTWPHRVPNDSHKLSEVQNKFRISLRTKFMFMNLGSSILILCTVKLILFLCMFCAFLCVCVFLIVF